MLPFHVVSRLNSHEMVHFVYRFHHQLTIIHPDELSNTAFASRSAGSGQTVQEEQSDLPYTIEITFIDYYCPVTLFKVDKLSSRCLLFDCILLYLVF